MQKFCSNSCGSKVWVSTRSKKRAIERQKFHDWWGYTGKHEYARIKLSEQVGMEILKTEGWESVKHISDYYRAFPFDLCGWRNGQLCFVDVTQSTHAGVKRRRRLLTDLGLGGYILFVKPDFANYALLPILSNHRRDVSIFDFQHLIKDAKEVKEIIERGLVYANPSS